MGKTWNINLKHPILPLYGVFEQNIKSIIKSWIGPKMALTEPSPLLSYSPKTEIDNLVNMCHLHAWSLL